MPQKISVFRSGPAPVALSTLAALMTLSAAARADVTISSAATENISCSAGICAPTAADAVLNVNDLETLLASGNVEVTTTGSGVQANNIDVTSAFTWTAANALTLDAFQSINVSAAANDGGNGGVSLVTNDGGSGGALLFLPKGSFGFASPKSALTINDRKYKLENTLKQMAYDIVAHPEGAFALANNYDAKREGVYEASPIGVPFSGAFNGLGNAISRLEIEDEGQDDVGLFATVKPSGVVSGVRLENIVLRAVQGTAGALVGSNEGIVTNSSSSGTVMGGVAGGLVGLNGGSIEQNTETIFGSSSTAIVKGRNSGGLVSENYGVIDESFATGPVHGSPINDRSDDGGLVGDNFARIVNSYATGGIRDRAGPMGGLVGFINESFGSIAASYATGAVKKRKGELVGGFLGWDDDDAGTIANCYWDTTTSGTTQGVGGNGSESGITGLTTQQLQSGLPTGFDPTIWAEDANINNGFPYLIANPPGG